MARLFLVGGGLLAVASLTLWYILPIRPLFPPYVVTAFLALSYGEFCRRHSRTGSPTKS
jgi:hypothetical protein